MHGATAMLLGATFGLLGLASAPAPETAAPDPEAEIRACLQTCDASDDETDRVTCRLNCYQATEGKDDVHITKWKKERHVGGTVPGQDAPPPPVTTVTTVTPRGTTTQTTTTGPAVAPRPALPPAVQQTPRQKYYFGLVGCQERCDGTTDASSRARCKLRCLRLQPGPPPPAAARAPGGATPSKAPAEARR